MSDAMMSAVVAGEDIYGVAAVTTTMVQQAQRIHGACPNGYTPQEMLQYALGGLPLQVLRHITPVWDCDCSRARVSQTLVALGTHELQQLVAEQQDVSIRCEFCTTDYVFTPQELVQLLHRVLAAQQDES